MNAELLPSGWAVKRHSVQVIAELIHIGGDGRKIYMNIFCVSKWGVNKGEH